MKDNCVICGTPIAIGSYCEFCRKDVEKLDDLIQKVKDGRLRERIRDKVNNIISSLHRKYLIEKGYKK